MINIIDTNKLKDVFPVLEDIISTAGRLAYSQQFNNEKRKVMYKEDNSPVTDADMKTESLIRNLIAAEFDNISVLGEEFGLDDRGSEWRFVVDPIDGTRSFMAGIPLWGTLIGLEHEGDPVLGAMYCPLYEKVLIGAPSVGCFFGGKEITIKDDVNDLSKVRAIINDFQLVAKHDHHGFVNELINKVAQIRGWGDAHGYLMVATGRADLMFDPYIEYYDVAAIRPIIEAAGGKFSSLSGARDFSENNAIAAAPRIHEMILEIINNL